MAKINSKRSRPVNRRRSVAPNWEVVSQERDAFKAGHDSALAAMDQLRREKETLTATKAEVAEKLRSHIVN